MRRFLIAWLLLVLVSLCLVPTPSISASRAVRAHLGAVAYIKHGDVWVQDVPTGSPQRLTQGGGYAYPLLSPSGKWLLVRKGEQFMVLRIDGGEQDTNGNPWRAAAWAPSDDRIAVVDHNGRLLLMDADGNRTWELARPEGDIGHLAWSPDGRAIAVEVRRMRATEESYAGIWRIDADGGQPRELYALRDPGPQCVTLAGWTGDGQFVLFWPHPICSSSIAADGLPFMAVPQAGGTARKLVDDVLLHPDYWATARTGELAVVAGGGRQTATDKRIALVHPINGAPQTITPATEAASSPAWSRDGKRLAYVSTPKPTAEGGEPFRQALISRRIWVASADGATHRQVADDPTYRDESPHWLDDQRHLLFVRLNVAEETSLWLVDAEGGSPKRIADMDAPPGGWYGYYGWVDWSALLNVHSGGASGRFGQGSQHALLRVDFDLDGREEVVLGEQTAVPDAYRRIQVLTPAGASLLDITDVSFYYMVMVGNVGSRRPILFTGTPNGNWLQVEAYVYVPETGRMQPLPWGDGKHVRGRSPDIDAENERFCLETEAGPACYRYNVGAMRRVAAL